ncbi:hypothetical protein ACIRF8_12370 [Streptomyces sp. NPDC102406]|uniref:hypothetical protein n=1 Tax=Streptomyces sp. NPDC102406 TaxID=3366171 RepID=UPI00380334FE
MTGYAVGSVSLSVIAHNAPHDEGSPVKAHAPAPAPAVRADGTHLPLAADRAAAS